MEEVATVLGGVAAETLESPEAPLVRSIRIQTDDWPKADRVAMFQENVGRDRVRIEPLPAERFAIDATMIKTPGLGLVWGRRSALRSDFTDDSDRLIINLGADAIAAQFGREHELKAGEAIAFCGSDVASLTTLGSGAIGTVEFPNGSLCRMMRDPLATCGRPIAARSPTLSLLRKYLLALWTSGGLESGWLQQVATAHVHDLALIVVGNDLQPRTRGIRAARLEALKADILALLPGHVTIASVAARHRLSTRYIGMLFASEQTSFTDFVRDARLDWAHRKLLSRGFDHLRISEIAYEAGFNDLSYFNRTFRRRFGKSPGDCREYRRQVPSRHLG